MDQQTPQQNNPYESISSSIPTFDSFSSQQNMTIEDETIDVETLGNEDKKRKRKAPTRKPKSRNRWKYLIKSLKMMKMGRNVENANSAVQKNVFSWCPNAHTHMEFNTDMLKTAIELKDAFFDYDFNNSCFARDLEETPKRADFEVCRKRIATASDVKSGIAKSSL
ncbi:hypothetical protein Tco_1323456 [Tanacetum coccineum]